MTAIPICASADELPEAIEFAQRRPTARWFVASKAQTFGQEDLIPADWGITAAMTGPKVSPAEKKLIDLDVAQGKEAELPESIIDPDNDGDDDLIASKDTDHDGAAYRKRLGLRADATNFEALIAGGYYEGEDFGVEDDYDNYDSDTELPLTASGAVVITAAFTAEQRKEFAKSKVALSDGSFPIPNKRYLGKAIRAVGRAKNNSKGTIRKHIVKRAKALGATYMLPDSYKPLTAATTPVDAVAIAKAALRTQVNRGKALEAAPQAITAGRHSLPEDLEDTVHEVGKAFDEALHPRGRDGKFITKGGRVIVHDIGPDHEGTVQDLTKNGIDVKTDAGHIERVQAKNLTNAPTAMAHLGTGSGSAPHENPTTASEHLANAQHHIAQADSHLEMAKNSAPTSAHSLGNGKPQSKRYISRELSRPENGHTHEVVDSHTGVIEHQGGRNSVAQRRDELNSREDRENSKQSQGSAGFQAHLDAAKQNREAAQKHREAATALMTPHIAEAKEAKKNLPTPTSTRYRASELSSGTPGATHDVEDTHTGTVITTTGRNKAMAKARELNRAEDAKAPASGVGGLSREEIMSKVHAGEQKDIANTAKAYGEGSPQHQAKVSEIAERAQKRENSPNKTSSGGMAQTNDRKLEYSHTETSGRHEGMAVFKPTGPRALTPSHTESNVPDMTHTESAAGRVGNFDKSTAKPGRNGESREAFSHLTKFKAGDHVVHTDEQGREHVAKVTGAGRGDHAFGANGQVEGAGSYESYKVHANYRPGGYTADVSNHDITSGKNQNIRHATSAEATQYEETAKNAANEASVAKSAAEKVHPIGSRVKAPRSYNAPEGEGIVSGHTPNGLVKVQRKGYANEDIENAHKPEELTKIEANSQQVAESPGGSGGSSKGAGHAVRSAPEKETFKGVATETHRGNTVSVRRGKQYGTMETRINGESLGNHAGLTNKDAVRHLDSAKSTVDNFHERPAAYTNGNGDVSYGMKREGASATSAKSAPESTQKLQEAAQDRTRRISNANVAKEAAAQIPMSDLNRESHISAKKGSGSKVILTDTRTGETATLDHAASFHSQGFKIVGVHGGTAQIQDDSGNIRSYGSDGRQVRDAASVPKSERTSTEKSVMVERAVQMHGSDRSTWSMANLRSAAADGDTQAAAALKAKLRAKAGSPGKA